MKRKLIRIALPTLALIAFAAGTALAEVHEVAVSNFTFTPQHISVQQGDTVRWVWIEGTHTATSGESCTPNGLFDAPISAANPTFEYTFNTESGVVPYFCIPHCAFDMTGTVTVEIGSAVGNAFDLSAKSQRLLWAVPNPFYSATVVQFQLAEAQHVQLHVHDATGRRIATLADRQFAAGVHAVPWDGRTATGAAAPAGIYYAKSSLQASPQGATLILLR